MARPDFEQACSDCNRRARWVQTPRAKKIPLVLCPRDDSGSYQIVRHETPTGTEQIAYKLRALDLIEARENSDAPLFRCLYDQCSTELPPL
jgi:hypothetical protein